MLAVGRAPEATSAPVKRNYDVLGNSSALHTGLRTPVPGPAPAEQMTREAALLRATIAGCPLRS